MIKDEIKSLKNELFKEIAEVENKINQKLLRQFEKNEENMVQNTEQFNKMIKKGESLLDSLSSQIINSDRINELENFRNKIDSMVISHEIRINNNIKDIQDIRFKYDREITENLAVPGFVGPSCKYKTISGYISSSIDEISKIKIENEVFKKENKELRKKVDEIIKTCLNLVNNTNTKFLQYVNNKTKNIEEFLNMKIGEFTDKMIDFKSLLMTQKNAKEMQASLMEELQNNNYTKKEIDDKISDILKSLETNIKDINMKFSNENILIKISVEKIEKEIIEIKKYIKEVKNKIKQINQIQSELMKKNNILMKTLRYNTSEKNLHANSIQNINSNFKISSPRKKANEEEKQMKSRNSIIKEKNRTIGSMEELRIKNNIHHHMSCTKLNNDIKDLIKLNSTNANSSVNKIIENSPKNISRNSKFLSSSSTQNEKEKFKTNLSNINSEENKETISDNVNDNENDLNLYIYPSNISYNKNDTIEKDENDNIISTPQTTKVKSLVCTNLNKTENINKRSICMLKKLNDNKNKNDIITNLKFQNNVHKNKNNISDLLSFGLSQNQKSIIMPVDNDKNAGISNNPIVQVMSEDLIKEKIDYLNNKSNNNNFINNKIVQKEKRNSIHKLAAIGFDEKANTLLPNVGEFSSRSLIGNNNKTITPIIKNIFQQSYQINKTYKNLGDDFPVKIKAAFGRTGYTLFDKKEEGIKYLINKGIENKIRKYKSHSTEDNFKLSPTARIKVFSNI